MYGLNGAISTRTRLKGHHHLLIYKQNSKSQNENKYRKGNRNTQTNHQKVIGIEQYSCIYKYL